MVKNFIRIDKEDGSEEFVSEKEVRAVLKNSYSNLDELIHLIKQAKLESLQSPFAIYKSLWSK